MEEDCSRNRAQAAAMNHQRRSRVCIFCLLPGKQKLHSEKPMLSYEPFRMQGMRKGNLRWTEQQTLRTWWLYTKVECYWEQEFWGKRGFIDTGQGWWSQGWRQVREWDKKGFFPELLEKPVGSQSWEIRSLRQRVGLDDLLRSFLSRCCQECISHHHIDNSKMSFLNREFICWIQFNCCICISYMHLPWGSGYILNKSNKSINMICLSLIIT